MSLPFRHVACVDFESFYDETYTLKKLPMTEYIRDARFEALSCAIQVDDAAPIVALGPQIPHALRQIDWKSTAFCGHHTQFDGLIATHHYGVYPAFWLDTLSMGRAIVGTDASVSLKALCARFGRQAKTHEQALKDVIGLRFTQMTGDQIDRLVAYNRDDVADTAWLYQLLVRHTPEEELRLIDITMRMYTEPVLLVDGVRAENAYRDEVERKRKLFDACGINVTELSSADKFAAHLRALGVEPPTQVSLRTKKVAYAFNKQSVAFKSLLKHPDERVRTLVEARLASKSTLVETRAQTIAGRAGLPTPIYLNYWGARTGRWSGGDSANWQNLPRKGLGLELRKSLCAPDGCMLVISDASQIEARTLAWHAGQRDILEAFARDEDVYALNGTNMYGYPVSKEETPDERFVAKTFTLGAGFGAGAPKVNYMLKVGQFGPAVDQPMEVTERLVAAWRASNSAIVAHWRRCINAATSAFLNQTQVDDGVVCFEGTPRGGYIHLPNGRYIFYPDVFYDEDARQLSYRARNGIVRFWHGLVVENITQALARVLLGQQLIVMEDTMPDIRLATTTHDEVVAVVPKKKAETYAANINRIMSTASPWAHGIPLNADTQIAAIYEKH